MDSKDKVMKAPLVELPNSTGSAEFTVKLTKNHYVSRHTRVWFDNIEWLVADQYNRFMLLTRKEGTIEVRAIKDQVFCTQNAIDSGAVRDRSNGPKTPRSNIEKIKKPKVVRKTKKKTFIPIAAHEAFGARLKEYQSGGRTITCFQYEPQAAEKYEFRIVTGSKTSPWILLTSSKWEFGIYYFYNVETAQYLKYDEAVHKKGKEVIWPEVA